MKELFRFIIKLFVIIGYKLWKFFVWFYTRIGAPLMCILALYLLFGWVFRWFIIVAIINGAICKLIEHFDLYS